MTRFLTDQGFEGVAPLAGWFEVTEPSGSRTTLGVAQELVHDGRDGWQLVLDGLAEPDCGAHLIPLLGALGTTLARLHTTLGSAPAASDFALVPGGRELTARVADGIVAAARDLLPRLAGHPDVGDLADRAADVITLARSLAERLDAGLATRHHGDLHLGQLLATPGGWVILDFEGEPDRSLEERRTKHAALRDVAGLLRSLSYATATATLDRSGVVGGWEAAARAALLDGYLAHADARLLPPNPSAVRRLLALLELEKVLYELGYELGFRPDWAWIPGAALRRTLALLPDTREVSS